MKVEYNGINIDRLCEAFETKGIVPLAVEICGNTTWITYPNDTDMTMIQGIVDSISTTEQTLEQRLEAAEEKIVSLERTISELVRGAA